MSQTKSPSTRVCVARRTPARVKQEKAYFEALKRKFKRVAPVEVDDRKEMKRGILAQIEKRLDEKLRTLAPGQGLAVALKVEVINRDGSFRGEPSARGAPEYRDWRTAVYERDGYCCTECGAKGALHAHHVIPWAECPERRFDVDNGATLCVSCHERHHPHMKAIRKSPAHRP